MPDLHALYVSDVFFPRVNGVSTSIETFRADLAELGVQTTLVAPDYGQPRTARGDVVRVRSRPIPLDPEDRLMDRALLRAAVEAQPERPYDLVHVQTPFVAHYAGLRAARRFGIPVVATCHTHFEDYLHHYLPLLPQAAGRLLARTVMRSQFRDVDAVIAPSEQVRDALLGYGLTVPIEVVPTGIPAPRFLPGDGQRFRREFGLSRDRPLVLIVGRVAHEKNLRFLLPMFAELRSLRPDVLVVVAGEGPARDWLVAETRRLRLEGTLRLVGNLDRDRTLNDCYAAADAFVFASRTETQGLVLLEAMAQGRPVVSTACLGTRSVLQPESGAVVVPEQERPFAEAVAAVLADPGRAARIGAAGLAWARRWSSEAMARRVAGLYEATCSREESCARRALR